MAKSAFPATLGGLYKFDPHEDLFIPGVDGEPEFPSLNQRWRAIEVIDPSDVDDVIANGIISPIRVRKRKDGRAEVIDGRQRARWARLANERLRAEGATLISVPGINDIEKNEHVAARKMASANYHRVDPSLMQRSDDAWTMLTHLGETDPSNVSKSSLQQVATTMRCSINTVRNYVVLQRLVHEAQRAAANRILPLNSLVALAGMSEDDQRTAITKLLEIKEKGGSNEAIVEAARATRDASEGVTYDGGDGDEGEGEGDDDDDDGEGEDGSAPTEGGEAAPKKATKKKPKKGKKAPPPDGLRAAQIRAVLRLAQQDRKDGGGAGTSLPDDAFKLLRVIVGEADARTVKGLTELLNRVAGGE